MISVMGENCKYKHTGRGDEGSQELLSIAWKKRSFYGLFPMVLFVRDRIFVTGSRRFRKDDHLNMFGV